MTAIGTTIISLSDTHIFANPSVTRYIITDLTNLLSVFPTFSHVDAKIYVTV